MQSVYVGPKQNAQLLGQKLQLWVIILLYVSN